MRRRIAFFFFFWHVPPPSFIHARVLIQRIGHAVSEATALLQDKTQTSYIQFLLNWKEYVKRPLDSSIQTHMQLIDLFSFGLLPVHLWDPLFGTRHEKICLWDASSLPKHEMDDFIFRAAFILFGK